MTRSTPTPPPCRWCGAAPEIHPIGWGILRRRKWIVVCPDIGCTGETGRHPSAEAAWEEWARMNGGKA
jgi:hypothetical protein